MTPSPPPPPPPPPPHAIIVGAGAAGTSCALHLHQLSPELAITLVDPSASLTVARALTRLGGARALDVAVDSFETGAWCAKHNIAYVRGRAIALRAAALVVRRPDGTEEALSFATLCVASGARPAVPAALARAVAARKALVVRDAPSVAALRSVLASARHAVVVGAGGIGMEIVHEASCEVTWLVRDGAVGAAFLDEAVVGWLRGGQDADDGTTEHKGGGGGDGDGDKVQTIQRLGQASLDASARPESLENVASDATAPPAAAVGPDWLGRRAYGVVLPDQGEKPAERRLPGRGRRGMRVESTHSVVDVVASSGPEAATHGLQAVLSDGGTIACDVVVVATGVHANTEWLRGSGVMLCGDAADGACAAERDGVSGVVVTAGEMQSSVRGVFAAGDCTSVRLGADAASCDWVQVRTWGQALAGGRAAACGMAAHVRRRGGYADSVDARDGGGLEFEVFAHGTRFFGRRVVMLGRWRAQGLDAGYTVLERGGGAGFVRVVLQGGRVRGAVLAGDVDRAEAFENLIASRLDVSWLGSRLVDEEFELEEFFD